MTKRTLRSSKESSVQSKTIGDEDIPAKRQRVSKATVKSVTEKEIGAAVAKAAKTLKTRKIVYAAVK